MKYTEYNFEHYDSSTGVNKVKKWIDGPTVDYLDYTLNKNKNYRLSQYDIKALVFNFIRNNDRDRVIDILKNIPDTNPVYWWDSLLEYNLNSSHKTAIFELAKTLIDRELYPSINQVVILIALNCDDINTLLKESKRDFKLGEPNFDEYFNIVNYLSNDQFAILESLGLKRNSDWDITIKTLKDNNMTGIKNTRRYKLNTYPFIDTFFEDSFLRPLNNPLYLL